MDEALVRAKIEAAVDVLAGFKYSCSDYDRYCAAFGDLLEILPLDDLQLRMNPDEAVAGLQKLLDNIAASRALMLEAEMVCGRNSDEWFEARNAHASYVYKLAEFVALLLDLRLAVVDEMRLSPPRIR